MHTRAREEMASFPTLRRHAERSGHSGGFRSLHLRVVAAALLVLAAASGTTVAILELATPRGDRSVHATPAFLTRALGAPQRHAALVRTPAPDVHVSIRKGGVGVATPDGSVALAAPAARRGGSWSSYRHGASRTTTFGRESVTVSPELAESYLTVGLRQGVRTWRWKLETSLTPRTSAGGYVGFFDGSRLVPLAIKPVQILDGSGHDVTPEGLRWDVVHRSSSWWLELRLDDAKLPLPYTIDPGVYRAATTTTTAAAGNTTVGLPVGARARDVLVLSIGVSSGTVPSTPSGFTAISGASSSYSTTVAVASFYHVVTAADVSGPASWTFAVGAESTVTLVDFRGIDSTSVVMDTGTAYSGHDKSSTCPAITPSAGATTPEHLVCSVSRTSNNGLGILLSPWTYQAGIGAASFGLGTGTYDDDVTSTTTVGPANSGNIPGGWTDDVGISFGLRDDTTAPVNGAISAGSVTGAAYQASAGSTIYFNSTLSGSFTLSDPFTDAQSSVESVQYPAAAGWTHTLETITTDPSFTSSAYSWTAGAGTPSLTLAETNGADLTSTQVVPITNDTTAPTSSVTCNGAACSNPYGSTVTVGLSGSDAGAGMKRIVYTTNGTNPTINTGTDTVTNGTAIAGSSGSFSVSTVGTTAVKWIVEDNVRNVSSVSTQNVQIATPPTGVTFSGSSLVYAATSTWTAGFTATASGALSPGNSVTVTFDAAFAAGIPASPTVTFGGSFAGCSPTTGSTAGNVVTVTLPAGCTLANSASGTVAVAGVTNPVPATYANTGFAVHTTSNAWDASPATGVTIQQKTLTVSGVTAANKTYDGATTAALNVGSASLVGVVAGDTVTLGTGSASGSFATKTVAAGKTVTVAGLTISGADAAKYTLTQPTTTANITAKTLTVSGVTAANKTYDGATTATLNVGSASLVGVVAGDTVTLGTGSASGSFATKTVAAGKTVTVAGLTISGADAANYTLTQPTTTANITAKTLTVSGVTAANKTYDGATTATLNVGSASLVGVVAGDTVTLGTGSASGSFATKTVAAGKTVTVAGLTISGADAANYTLTQPTTTANITAKTLTVSGATAANKTYDATTTATLNLGSASLVGVVAGDTVTIDGTGASGSFATKTAGTGKTVTVAGIALAGADAGNYTVTQPSGLTADITAKTLTVTGAAAQNKTYDGTTTATLDLSGASLTGVVAGDTVTLDGSAATGSFATKTVAAGKTVTVAGLTLSGADAANYTLTQPTTTANITAKALTVSGVTAASKTYDGSTTATLDLSGASLTGVVAGDTVAIDGSGASGSFATGTAGTGKTVTSPASPLAAATPATTPSPSPAGSPPTSPRRRSRSAAPPPRTRPTTARPPPPSTSAAPRSPASSPATPSRSTAPPRPAASPARSPAPRSR